MLIWNERYLQKILVEYISWYNTGRVHQGIQRIPDPDPSLSEEKPADGKLVAIPILNGIHHYYRLAA